MLRIDDIRLERAAADRPLRDLVAVDSAGDLPRRNPRVGKRLAHLANRHGGHAVEQAVPLDLRDSRRDVDADVGMLNDDVIVQETIFEIGKLPVLLRIAEIDKVDLHRDFREVAAVFKHLFRLSDHSRLRDFGRQLRPVLFLLPNPAILALHVIDVLYRVVVDAVAVYKLVDQRIASEVEAVAILLLADRDDSSDDRVLVGFKFHAQHVLAVLDPDAAIEPGIVQQV